MKTARWIAMRFGIGILLLFVVAAGLLAGLIVVTLPGESGTVRLPGLSAPVIVRFGARGVPYIQATNSADAAEALGYLQARERLFQMELMRRLAEGRLSAWFGSRTLATDEQMRTLGLKQAAISAAGALDPRTRTLLDAYARGANAWIDQRGRFSAWEFLYFGKPQHWRPRDSLLWSELLANQLSGNAWVELQRLTLARSLPRTKIMQLWPKVPVPPPDSVSRHNGSAPFQFGFSKADVRAARAALSVIPRFPAPFTGPSTASNEWAVAGNRSATGAPLLAGDPHLGFTFPSLWYLARINTPLRTLAGATAPGTPFLIFGHNRHIAWTFTNNGAAVQDVFIFRRIGHDHYLGPAGPLAFGIKNETIRVAGRHPVAFTVRSTIDGPVLTLRRHTVLALDAVNLTRHDRAAEGIRRLDDAPNLGAADAAADLITTPVENLLVASRRRIGLFVTGCVPLRGMGNGAWPLEGDKVADQWTGLACGSALPRIIAPASGVIVNTNEQVAPPNFPVDMGRDQSGDWRSERIRADLAKHQHLTVADFSAIQHDVISAYAQALLPTLNKIHPATPLARQAVALLRGWNGAMHRDAPQPLIFNAWVRAFRNRVLLLNHVPLTDAGLATRHFVQFLLTSPIWARGWCGGSCAPLLSAAADHAMASLARTQGDNPARWTWGSVHRAVFTDTLLGHLPLIGRLISPSISVGGDGSTVDRSVPAPSGWTAIQGPSYRGIYELADLNRSRFIMAPGQSGDVFSPQSRDFLKSWRDNDTITLKATPRKQRGKLVLLP
jgi:penicillin amidase